MTRTCRLLSLLIAVSIGPTCATPPRVLPEQFRGWHGVASGDFRMLGDVPPDELEQLALQLALFSATATRLGGLADEPARVPVTVLVIRDRALMDLLRDGSAVAGQMWPTLEGYYAQVRAARPDFSTRSTLYHEYTHFLLHKRHHHPYPAWFHEGLAVYLSSLRVRDDVIVVGAPNSGRLRWVAARGPVPLDEIFQPGKGRRTGEEVADFYATSWAFVHLLLSTPSGRRQITRLSALLARGVGPGEAEVRTFGRDHAPLERELRAHVARLVRGVRHDLVLEVDRLDPPRIGEVTPLPPAEVAYTLGYAELLAAAEGSKDALLHALAFLEAAVELDASHARALAGLAEARARRGDGERAAALLQRARELDPDGGRVALHAARIAALPVESGDTPSAAERAGAETAYARARAAAPRSPAPHAGLGRLQRSAGRPDEAMASFERARELGAWTPSLDLALGALYLENGRVAGGRALLRPLVAHPHAGEISEEARRLLDELGEEERPN